MDSTDFNKVFDAFGDINVAVIGDVMLDTYWWGKVDRISPEAPVPVVAVTKREQRIGGAGNVALNVKALGCRADIISVIGDDEDGEQLTGLLDGQHIGTKYLVRSRQRVTTNKIRIISRNQQMMRLDAEMTNYLTTDDEDALIQQVTDYVETENPQIVILEDYNKGVLTERVITSILALCNQKNILTAVDPKRKNFFAFQHVDIFKPNLHEAKEALNIITEDIDVHSLCSIHEDLHDRLHHKISFITLSEKGVFYYDKNGHALIPTHIRSIADVSGAGDTVIAVASVVYAVTKDVHMMAEVANIAGGLVCEEVGTVAIDKDKLLAECNLLLA